MTPAQKVIIYAILPIIWLFGMAALGTMWVETSYGTAAVYYEFPVDILMTLIFGGFVVFWIWLIKDSK